MKYRINIDVTGDKASLLICLRRIVEEIERGETEMTDYEKSSAHIYWDLGEAQ